LDEISNSTEIKRNSGNKFRKLGDNRIVVITSVRVIMYVDAAINYVVPSKVTSVPVLTVLTTTTGRTTKTKFHYASLFGARSELAPKQLV